MQRLFYIKSLIKINCIIYYNRNVFSYVFIFFNYIPGRILSDKAPIIFLKIYLNLYSSTDYPHSPHVILYNRYKCVTRHYKISFYSIELFYIK